MFEIIESDRFVFDYSPSLFPSPSFQIQFINIQFSPWPGPRSKEFSIKITI